jgi:hypothetical protein
MVIHSDAPVRSRRSQIKSGWGMIKLDDCAFGLFASMNAALHPGCTTALSPCSRCR